MISPRSCEVHKHRWDFFGFAHIQPNICNMRTKRSLVVEHELLDAHSLSNCQPANYIIVDLKRLNVFVHLVGYVLFPVHLNHDLDHVQQPKYRSAVLCLPFAGQLSTAVGTESRKNFGRHRQRRTCSCILWFLRTILFANN